MRSGPVSGAPRRRRSLGSRRERAHDLPSVKRPNHHALVGRSGCPMFVLHGEKVGESSRRTLRPLKMTASDHGAAASVPSHLQSSVLVVQGTASSICPVNNNISVALSWFFHDSLIRRGPFQKIERNSYAELSLFTFGVRVKSFMNIYR